MLRCRPITQREAFAYIAEHHRHHKPPVGWMWGIAAYDDDRLCGVITVGRPVARMLDKRLKGTIRTTCEANRCCTDGTYNACSLLYGAAWRAAKAMGWDECITYLGPGENGASLKASGWICVGAAGGGLWSRADRERDDDHPTGQKTLWRIGRDMAA
jgi:hypothetical protein